MKRLTLIARQINQLRRRYPVWVGFYISIRLVALLPTTTAAGTILPPDPPEGVAVEALSEQSLRVTWETNPPTASQIVLFRSQTPGLFYEELLPRVRTTEPRQFDDQRLSPNRNYFYQLRAFDERRGLWSPFTPPVQGTTLCVPPYIFFLSSVWDDSFQIHLGAANPSDTEHLFQLAEDQDFTQGVRTSPDWVPDDRYRWTGLAPTTRYFVRAKARNRAIPPVETQWSNIGSTVTLRTGQPTTVRQLGATAVATRRIRLSWVHDNRNLNYFLIERSVDGGERYTEGGRVFAGALTTYTFMDQPQTAIPFDTTLYRVTAIGSSGIDSQSATTPRIVGEASRVQDFSVDIPFLVQNPVEARVRVVMDPDRELRFFVVRQGEPEPIRDDIIPHSPTPLRRTFNLPLGVNLLTFSLRDLVDGELIPNTVIERRVVVQSPVPPPAPSDLSATTLSSTVVQLSWQNPSQAVQINIYRSQGDHETGVYDRIATVDVPEHFYMDAGRSPDSRRFYKVTALNAGGESDFTPSVAGVTHAAQPALDDPTFDFVYGQQLRVRWSPGGNPPPQSTLYVVELSTRSAFDPPDQTAEVRTIAHDFVNLVPTTLYHLRVKARNRVGIETPYTLLGSTRTLPGTPSRVTLSLLPPESIHVSWDPHGNPPPDTRYQLELARTPTFTSGERQTAVVQGTSYDWRVFYGPTYYFRVRAINIRYGTIGIFSETTRLQTPYPVTPSAPTNITAAGASSEAIHLTWRNPTTLPLAQQIHIYRSDLPIGRFEQIGSVYLSPTEYPETSSWDDRRDLTPNTRRFYRLSGWNERGEGPMSDPATQGVTLAAPPQARDFGEIRERQLSVRWGANGNPSDTPYVVELATQRDFLALVSSATVQVTSYTFMGLQPNTLYFSQVKARNLAGVDSAYTFLGSTVTRPSSSQTPPLPPSQAPRGSFLPIPGTLYHRGLLQGVVRTLPALVSFSQAVTIPESAVHLTVIRNSLGRPINQIISVRPVLDNLRLLLRHPQTLAPVTLPGHAVYRLEISRDVIDAVSGIPLERALTLIFRTSMDPDQTNTAAISDADQSENASRLLIPPHSFGAEEAYVIMHRGVFDTPLQSGLPDRVRAAIDRARQTQNRLVLVDLLHEVGAYGISDGTSRQPQNPLTLSLSYVGAQGIEAISSAPFTDSSLQMAWFNPSTNIFEALPSRVDADHRIVSADTSRLGVFALMRIPRGADGSTLTGIFPFPVPFQPGLDASHRDIKFANTPRGTNIKIFTVTGKLVRELLTADDTHETPWDVKNRDGQDVASDVYLYQVQTPDGARKTGKLMVIR